jgi:hypothetical protein
VASRRLLRADQAANRREPAAHHPKGVMTRHPDHTERQGMSRKRSIVVYTMVGVATLLLLIGSFTVWTKRELLNTDAWTASSAEVLANPQVRSALADRLVQLLYQNVNVAAELRQVLPKPVQSAAPTVANVLETGAQRAAYTLLSTSRAQTLRENANRRAHAAIVNVLEGHPVGPISTANGAVVLDLQPLVNRVFGALGAVGRGHTLPPNAGQIVLLRPNQLKTAQDAVKLVKVLSQVIAIVALALYALAIYFARNRRRVVLEVSGATFVFVGLVVLIARRFIGQAIVDELVHTQSQRPVVYTIWLIETNLLRDIGIALLAYGALGIIAAWLGGRSRPAVAIRRWLAPTFHHRPAVIFAAAALVFLIVIAWGPTGATHNLLGVVVLAVLVGLGIEAWRRETIREFPDREAAPEQVTEATPAHPATPVSGAS